MLMNLSTIGALIKQYRLASGLSQSELAEFASISRATLNYLESGRLNELGASKVFKLVEVLGIPFTTSPPTTGLADDSALKKAAKSANVSYLKPLPQNLLEDALCAGSIPPGYEANMLHFIDELPESMIIETVRAVAAKRNIAPKKVWANARGLAKQVHSPRKLWHGA